MLYTCISMATVAGTGLISCNVGADQTGALVAM